MASVLNVVTVHWQSPQWIDIQLGYLERNIDGPWRVFASLNGIEKQLWDRFHFAAELDGDHPEKLNELAQVVAGQSAADDLIVFLDGDAFPVRPVGFWLDSLLSSHPLAALRRDENLGDPQPHPAFCVTTVGFWREIEGDWRAGYTWENAFGTTTDVGGRLLQTLQERKRPWRPILRTNTNNIHPIWFGVYEHRIYHHGAGFRPRVSRLDIAHDPVVYGSVNPLGVTPADTAIEERDRSGADAGSIENTSVLDVGRVPGGFGDWRRRRNEAHSQRRRDRQLRRDEQQAARVFSWIADGDVDFYLRLDRAAAGD